MLKECKSDNRIKYVIFDELDRFMRSMLELAYFIVEFKKLGVKVVFASQPNLTTDTATDTLLLMLEAYKAEGSNEERQRKSIAGQTAAIVEGRWPFVPKPGYKRGYERGVPEIDEVRGPALQEVLTDIIDRKLTPTQALIKLNKSSFIKGRALYKMDKFRAIATDPFYAGILVIDKQVSVRNEAGLHKPLITYQQHMELVKIFEMKKKFQTGPRKGGNPKYPLNNLISHDLCSEKPYGRIVGVDIHNGRNRTKIYEKYRCRECKQSLPREDLHSKFEAYLNRFVIDQEGVDDLIEALNLVWKQKEGEAEQNARRLLRKVSHLNESIANHIEALTDPGNASISNEIRIAIEAKKQEISELENQIEQLGDNADNDKEAFLRFAFGFLNELGTNFLSISQENRLRCKQIVFPGGFRMDNNKNVYTTELSPLYRLATNKKDLPVSEKSFMVRVQRL